MLQVGEDWLLRNPSGRKVAANGIETDYQILFLERKNGNVIGAEGLNGTVVEIRDSQGKNQAVKVK